MRINSFAGDDDNAAFVVGIRLFDKVDNLIVGVFFGLAMEIKYGFNLKLFTFEFSVNK